MDDQGQIVILNGAPRSGKSSIAQEIVSNFSGSWVNLGVDQTMRERTPQSKFPGIGLRPGENRSDLEEFIVTSYRALYQSIANHSRRGDSVAVDVGHHDVYSKPLGILPNCMQLLSGLPVLIVGVRCDLGKILERRAASSGDYLCVVDADDKTSPILLWQEAVHQPGIYDLEVDTSWCSPGDCAQLIEERLVSGVANDAAERLARL